MKSIKSLSPVLPWIGSYFNIPAPEQPAVAVTHFRELEMHVLCQDLSTKTYTLRYETYSDDVFLMLRNMAYIDRESLAYMVYSFTVNTATGERKKDGVTYQPSAKIKGNTWKTFDQLEGDPEFEYEYVPSIYKTFSNRSI